MKHDLESISQLLPTPSTNNGNQIISAKTVNDIYSNIAQGLNSCKRGLQVIDITLHEVRDHELDPETFEYLSAATITAKAIDEYGFDTPAERNRIKIHTLNDFIFKVDETAYIYVIFNIIKNAAYYFKQYPNADITIGVDRKIITITDTGSGIPEPIFSKLFKEFSTAGKSNGTGLGLAYCQRTMQTFSGTISCESVVGQYTTFTLTFPVISREEIESHTNYVFQTTAPLFAHQRVLMVDDEDLYHSTVQLMLKGLGCEIDAAKDGEQALALLRTTDFDLIIMDLNMPVKDGYTNAVEIRSGAVPHQTNIPIIAHTNEPHHMAKIKTQKVGMDGFISKKSSQLELVTTIFKTMKDVKDRVCSDRMKGRLAGKTILIADDELFNRQLMEIHVSQWGIKSLHADCGQSALDLLEKNPGIDFISMDMHMPGMCGIETTKCIRANPAYRDIIIVAVSADCSENWFREAKACGINDFVSKPVDQAVLKNKLMRLLASATLTAMHAQPVWTTEYSVNRFLPVSASDAAFF